MKSSQLNADTNWIYPPSGSTASWQSGALPREDQYIYLTAVLNAGPAQTVYIDNSKQLNLGSNDEYGINFDPPIRCSSLQCSEANGVAYFIE